MAKPPSRSAATRTASTTGPPPTNTATQGAAAQTAGVTATNPGGQTATNGTGGLGYGWLGGDQRAVLGAGLTLMGARLYNPVQGQFTSVDPVYEGNTTPYSYPQDPINQVDLDGYSKGRKDRHNADELSGAEKEAVGLKLLGLKYNKKAYNSAMKKLTQGGKMGPNPTRNKQKRGSSFSFICRQPRR